jgi:cobalamin biosynthesis protein CobW
MQQLIKRRDSIDCILIETSGLALPKPLVKAFRWQEIRNAATVDAAITVVDCAAVASGTFASDPEAIAIHFKYMLAQTAELNADTTVLVF